MQNTVLIIDFGSKYTQLIARRVREQNIYCEIHPFNNLPENLTHFKAVILSGSTASISDKAEPWIDLSVFEKQTPILAIGYSAAKMLKSTGGKIKLNQKDHFYTTTLNILKEEKLFSGVSKKSEVWTNNEKLFVHLPENFIALAENSKGNTAAYQLKNSSTYGLSFHPEVFQSAEGAKIIQNFLLKIADLKQTWTPAAFISSAVKQLQTKIGDQKVVLGLSGGVDSTVTAVLLNKAIGKNLYCIFVNNGLLRKNEFQSVLENYKDMGLNVKGVDASENFLNALSEVSDPEQKRKIIGKLFIETFDQEAQKIENVKFLGQGTIYPDVIESVSIDGKSVAIKSHHNVGGLPEKMDLKIVEPLRNLFKDEVRKVGKELGIKQELIGRHPFPGPGLAIRILGDITKEKVKIIQEVDAIFINALKEEKLYDKIWQAGAILLPIQSVGVTNDERTYERVVALRAVNSIDGMTADWIDLPYEFLRKISTKIITEVKGVNRVVYDISSKPPATIEWE